MPFKLGVVWGFVQVGQVLSRTSPSRESYILMGTNFVGSDAFAKPDADQGVVHADSGTVDAPTGAGHKVTPGAASSR